MHAKLPVVVAKYFVTDALVVAISLAPNLIDRRHAVHAATAYTQSE